MSVAGPDVEGENGSEDGENDDVDNVVEAFGKLEPRGGGETRCELLCER